MKLSTSLVFLVVIGLVALTVDAQSRKPQRGNRPRGGAGGRRRGPNCHLKEVDKCLEKMEALGNRPQASDIITNDAGITELCTTVENSQTCIKGFFKKCGTPIQRELFDFVLEQFTESVKQFCNEGDTRETFLKHSPCINEKVLTKKSYHDGCVTDIFAAIDKGSRIVNATLDDPDLFNVEKAKKRTTSDELLDLTCCSYNRFDACSQGLIVKDCGQGGVDAMTNFVEKTFGGQIDMICPKNLFNPKDAMCTKVMPPHGAKPKGKLSDNPIGKYMLTYMNFIFNYHE